MAVRRPRHRAGAALAAAATPAWCHSGTPGGEDRKCERFLKAQRVMPCCQDGPDRKQPGRRGTGKRPVEPGRAPGPGGLASAEGVTAIDPSHLSHKVGHGRTSETFRLRDGRIIKMLSASVPQSRAERELRLAQQAAAAGLPVWQIQELVRCGDRWGLLGEALPGETVSLARRLLQRPWELNHWFSAFIELHQQINRTPAAHLPPI